MWFEGFDDSGCLPSQVIIEPATPDEAQESRAEQNRRAGIRQADIWGRQLFHTTHHGARGGRADACACVVHRFVRAFAPAAHRDTLIPLVDPVLAEDTAALQSFEGDRSEGMSVCVSVVRNRDKRGGGERMCVCVYIQCLRLGAAAFTWYRHFPASPKQREAR